MELVWDNHGHPDGPYRSPADESQDGRDGGHHDETDMQHRSSNKLIYMVLVDEINLMNELLQQQIMVVLSWWNQMNYQQMNERKMEKVIMMILTWFKSDQQMI